jgi:NAD(P)-dependent dehydrogenase (short-subunit alcohol dehydrogenase family)
MNPVERIIPARESVYLDGPKPRINEFYFAWDVFKQFIKGFRALHFLDPCITVFGSARFPEQHTYYQAAREFGKQMLARRRGNIVNVASIAGLHGVIDRSAYNASKHGLIGLTRTLAAEWGSRGVRVNAICPGWIKTEMDEADQGSGAYSDSDIINRVPMGRFAKPEDVARAIAFLAQEDSFINGVSLPVDGGWVADASWDDLRLKKR